MTNSPFLLWLFGSLAVWRASVLVVEEEGPFGGFAALRNRLDPYQKTWLGRGLGCIWCVSWWAALATALWYWWFGLVALPMLPIWWFGMSASAILIQQWLEWTQKRQRHA